MLLPLSKIKPNPFQERKTFEGIESLAETIKVRGFWGSLLARKSGSDYEIAFGERRLRAAKLAKLKEIELEVRDLSDKEMMELTVLENSNRSDVPPLERAEHFKRYMKMFDYTEREAAKNLNIPVSTINDLIQLLNLSACGQTLVREEKIGWRVAQEANKAGGDKLVRRAAVEKMTTAEVQNIGKAIRINPKAKVDLINGDITPEELEIQMLRLKPKTQKSLSEVAHQCNKEISKMIECIHIMEDIWGQSELSRLDKTLWLTGFKLLKKAVEKCDSKCK